MSYGLQTDANDLIQSHFTVFIRRTFVSCLMSCDIFDAFVHREKMVCQMAEMGLVSRVTPVHTALRNSTRDEGGPFEVDNQVLISSHRKLLWSKAMVVSVAEKPKQDSGRHD